MDEVLELHPRNVAQVVPFGDDSMMKASLFPISYMGMSFGMVEWLQKELMKKDHLINGLIEIYLIFIPGFWPGINGVFEGGAGMLKLFNG